MFQALPTLRAPHKSRIMLVGDRMNNHLRGLAAWVSCAVALTLMGASNVPNLPMPPNSAMIYNAGSGDFAGFRIVVVPAGQAVAIDGAGHTSNELQQDVVQKFFADLAAAGPLSQLPAGDCSASKPETSSTTVEVNAAIVVTWNGQHSPALSCVSDPRAQRILLDATTIQRSLYVAAYRKRTTLAYGSAYHGASYQVGGYDSAGANYGGGSDHFYTDRFQNSGFYWDNFDTGQMTMDRFDNSGRANFSSPFGTAPGASPVFSNVPYASPYGGAPSATIPNVYPWSPSPGTGITPSNPYSSAPYGTAPNSVIK
jgi:hypothetical protein